MAQVQYYGTGRRKSSVARVRLVPGEGRVIINGRDFENYIPFAALREVVKQPLVATETLGNYDTCKRKWWWIHWSSWCYSSRYFSRFIKS